MKSTLIALALLSTIAAAPAPAQQPIEETFDASSLATLRIDFPVGELTVEGTDSGRVEVTLRASCGRRPSDSCIERAERIELFSDVRGDTLRLEVEGYGVWRSRGLDVEMQVRAPSRLALNVDAGIGEVKVNDMDADVTVDLGIGEASVRMRESSVDTVNIDTGVGESSLRNTGGTSESAGLFTREVEWDRGSGRARVRVDVGIGEASVRLS